MNRNRLAAGDWVVLPVVALMVLSFPLQTGAQAPPARTDTYDPVATRPQTNQDQERVAAVILIKNVLIAVNQGSLTGNYTVLRDLCSPGFRNRNSATDLGKIFQNISETSVDLSPIVVLDPILNQPRVNAAGQLLLEGHFASQDLKINFQLAFLKSAGSGWMIDTITLGILRANAPPSRPLH